MTRAGIEEAATLLASRAHGRVRTGGSIAALTSYRIGGPAGVLLEAASESDLHALASAVRETGVPVLVIGRGSNILISDHGYSGIVTRLGSGFRWSRVEGDVISAGAAVPLPSLATLALRHDLSGLEFAVAIPASMGGAVRMNAGAHGRAVADVLTTAEAFLLGEGRTVTLTAAEVGFAYRTTALPHGAIVTAASLRLAAAPSNRIAAAMNEAKDWRRTTQPLNLPNAGSVFKNPPGDHAARLVETVCGKGMRVGGASISEVHANFIVAEEGALADHVYTLIRRIQRRVLEETGIELELELKLIGEFEEVA